MGVQLKRRRPRRTQYNIIHLHFAGTQSISPSIRIYNIIYYNIIGIRYNTPFSAQFIVYTYYKYIYIYAYSIIFIVFIIIYKFAQSRTRRKVVVSFYIHNNIILCTATSRIFSFTGDLCSLVAICLAQYYNIIPITSNR